MRAAAVLFLNKTSASPTAGATESGRPTEFGHQQDFKAGERTGGLRWLARQAVGGEAARPSKVRSSISRAPARRTHKTSVIRSAQAGAGNGTSMPEDDAVATSRPAASVSVADMKGHSTATPHDATFGHDRSRAESLEESNVDV
ncbi:MAG: hypothetical protein R3E48_13780 [Burkholderiaceae bacterium]